MIRLQEKSKIHMITYAALVTKNMMHFNGLLYYVISSLLIDYAVLDWLSIELEIFAGRLYMNFAECAVLKRYLRLEDSFNLQSSSEHVDDIFIKNSINFLLNWLTLRRKRHDIMHTFMNYVCQERLLHSNHFFFADWSANADDAVEASAGGQEIDVTLKKAEEKNEKNEKKKKKEMNLEDEWDSINQRKMIWI